jgi:cytochrome P450
MKKAPKIEAFILSFLVNLVKDPINYLTTIQTQYGDIFYKHFLGYDQFFICHPEYAEPVLFSNQENYRKNPILAKNFQQMLGKNNLLTTNDIEQWSRDRKLAQTFFDPEVFFERYSEIITSKCKILLDQWQQSITKEPIEIPIAHELDKLVLGIIGDTIFHELNLDIEEMVKHIPEIFTLLRQKSISLTNLSWILPTKKRYRYLSEQRFLQETAKEVILARLAQKKDYDDLLSMFLHAYQIKNRDSEHFMSTGYQMLTFNVVGYNSTTSALRWIFSILASRPEIADQITAEVLSVCNDNVPTYADFDKLNYTKAVINEILRLYPPLAFYLRQAISTDTIQGYLIPAEACVTVSPYHIHRHPDFWEHPNLFHPERFLTKKWGQDYQYAYIPFGAGKRSCIARNFALLELCLIVAMVLQRFHLILPKGFQCRMIYVASIFLRSNLETLYIQPR